MRQPLGIKKINLMIIFKFMIETNTYDNTGIDFIIVLTDFGIFIEIFNFIRKHIWKGV
jgi:hypothetical protein